MEFSIFTILNAVTDFCGNKPKHLVGLGFFCLIILVVFLVWFSVLFWFFLLIFFYFIFFSFYHIVERIELFLFRYVLQS